MITKFGIKSSNLELLKEKGIVLLLFNFLRAVDNGNRVRKFKKKEILKKSTTSINY